MPEPIAVSSSTPGSRHHAPIAAEGLSFGIYEWQGSGPATLHVHHTDDEAWHVLEGTLRFRFAGHEMEARAGATVFVPAGVPHSYVADETARYLIILTPRLRALIAALHESPPERHRGVMEQYHSEILE